MTFKLSPSSINLMLECERCFWLTQHKVWKRPAGIFPSLPSGMDRVLKQYFNNFRDKGILPPELHDRNECQGMQLFNDATLLELWQNNFKGLQYVDEEGNILHGAIDNLLVKDGKMVVLDYKTRGYALKEDTAAHYQHQLNFYNFLLQKNGYATEDYAFLLFYIPQEVKTTGEIIFNKDLIKLKIDIQTAEQTFAKALHLLNNNCPSACCTWCDKQLNKLPA